MKSLAKFQRWTGLPANRRNDVVAVLLELRGARSPLTSKDLVRRLAARSIGLVRVRRALMELRDLHLADWRAEWVSRFGYRRAWSPKRGPRANSLANTITNPGAFVQAGIAAGLIGPGARSDS